MIKLFFFISLLLAPAVEANIFVKDRTEQEIQEKIEKLPKEGKDRTKSILYSELGHSQYKLGRFKEAVESYEQALRHRPSDLTKRHIYLFLGKCYESIGRMDKAIEAYESSVEYDKRNWKRHRDLATSYEQANLYSNAVDSYKNAIKYNSREPSLYFSLGRTYRKLGFYYEAEKNQVRAMDLGYSHGAVFQELSIVFEGLGRFSEAAASLKEVIGAGSSIADWGRLIYLSALAKDKKMVGDGLKGLYQKKPNRETVLFYEDIARVMTEEHADFSHSDLKSSYLQSLINGVSP